MSLGKVSVIIPCYHNNSTIKETLDGVFSQSYKDYEIIIVDNGMTLDKSVIMENGVLPDKVKIVESEKQLGAAGGRNLGVKNATGKYVAFCDADDLWLRDKLDMQVKVMTRFKKDGKAPILCFTARDLIDENSRPFAKYIGCNKVVDYERLLKTNQISTSSVLMERETALKHPFPDVEFHEDYVLWLQLLKEGNYAVGINRPLLWYRVSKNSKSGNKIRSAVMTYKVYEYIGLKPADRFRYMCSYIIRGIKKYY